MKFDLPVILLNGLVLLPNNEIRLEFDSNISKSIIDVAEMFHDNRLLVVSRNNVDDINDLPKIGVVAKIDHKLQLPNGITRVVITGITRARVIEYMNLNDNSNIEAIVENLNNENIEIDEEQAIIKKLQKEIELYIKSIPYISNSILSKVLECKDLSNLTDLVAPFITTDSNRLFEYLNVLDLNVRYRMILEDIYHERQNFELEKQIDFKVKKEIDKSQKEYILREKLKTIKTELGDVTQTSEDVDNLYDIVNNNNYPEKIKKRLLKEIKRYEQLPSVSPEVGVLRTYIDWLIKLPIEETKDNDNLKNVKSKLDFTHSGLDLIKQRIVEYLAVKKNTNNLKTPIICLVGPPGVGKTTLAKSIADALNRKFVKMSVGGINDEAEIIGHRKTYLGASPGRIIQSIVSSKSSNPVFLIDEVDKMTKDIKGDPASCLLSVLDYSQNNEFSDNYIEENYDLSKVMFILTANYIENIPEPLKDRLEIIELSGYTEYEKLSIAKNYLLPKVLKEHGLDKLTISDKLLLNIINNYTKESGVRELERLISTIVRKVVYEKVVNDNNIKVKELESFLGKPKYIKEHSSINNAGVINGLAYTTYGGDTLKIETNYYPGKGNLILTGQLGDVMKESCSIALSYIKANYKQFNIDIELLNNSDIHIHFPAGAIKKDGPSAGIAITSSIIGAFTNRKVSNTIAMTGEIGLHGEVLPIGGLKEKSLGALRNNIKRIIIPFDNSNDYDELDEFIKEKIEFISVKNYNEVYKIIYKER